MKMKEKRTYIIRRFDDLGRIMIPRVVREQVFGKSDIEGELMEILYKEDGTIILKPIEN